MFRRIYFLTLAFCFLSSILQASPIKEDLVIKSYADKDKLSQNDTLTLKIEVTGFLKWSPEIELPDLKNDFEVISSLQSQSISIAGKEKKQTAVFEYILLPKKSGKITIGEVEMKYSGKTYKTMPIDIEVTPSEIKPKPLAPEQEENPLYNQEQGTII
ncbi:MAG: BatD family protein [Candidatus Omnitrophota bacterium]|nr:BatD family protein [Candidatus Omnitrophota bacterium]